MTVEASFYEKSDENSILRVVLGYRVYPDLVGVSDISVVPQNSFDSVEAVVEAFRYCFSPTPEHMKALAALMPVGEHSDFRESDVTPVFLTVARGLKGVKGGVRLSLTPHGVVTVGGKQPGYLLGREDDIAKLACDLYAIMLPFVVTLPREN